jgi:uncharacterized protein (DUF362 family)
MGSTVAIAKASTRYATVAQALRLVEDDVAASLRGRKRVLLKPNLVTDTNQLAATHVDTMRAVLDVLRDHDVEEVIVGEGSARDTFSCYRKYGYTALTAEYDVQLLDLNQDAYEEIPIVDSEFRETTLKVSKTMLEAEYRISTALLKTHDTVIVTLAMKNIVVGSLVGSEKSRIHQGYPAMNVDLCKIIQRIPPTLAVLDGFVAMDGDGPVSGSPVAMGVALAGLDYVAVDAVAATLMGFDPRDVGYLFYAGQVGLGTSDLSAISIRGESLDAVRRRFTPHRTTTAQRQWAIPNWDRFF